MIVVGERLNTSRKGPAAMVAARDADAVVAEAVAQKEAGSDYIDVNAGTFTDREPELLKWMVTTVQEALPVPLCLDSSNPEAIREALTVHKGKALVNSITAERARYSALLPLVKEYGCAVVALCLDDQGMPTTGEDAFVKGRKLVEDLLADGVPAGDIYVDPLVRPCSVDPKAGQAVVSAISRFMAQYPGIHTICGLSNISFGLPQRRLLNQAFLVSAITAGLDAVILDPLDRRLMGLLLASEAVLAKDAYCRRYIQAYRQGRLSEA